MIFSMWLLLLLWSGPSHPEENGVKEGDGDTFLCFICSAVAQVSVREIWVWCSSFFKCNRVGDHWHVTVTNGTLGVAAPVPVPADIHLTCPFASPFLSLAMRRQKWFMHILFLWMLKLLIRTLNSYLRSWVSICIFKSRERSYMHKTELSYCLVSF